jgi:PAS domain S-box-containing protein
MRSNIKLLKRGAVILAATSGIITLLVLIGWCYDIALLKRPVWSYISMNPISAVCFIFSAVSLCCLFKKVPCKFSRYLIKSFSLVVIFIASVKLSAIVFNHSFGIDSWLFSKKLVQDKAEGNGINHMCMFTAINMVLLGFATFFSALKNKRSKTIASHLASATLSISGFTFIGYIFKVIDIYGLRSHISMPFYTTICFMFNSLAILFYNRNAGYMKTITSAFTGGFMARLLIPTVVGVPVLIGYIWLIVYKWHPYSVELGVTLLTTCIVIVFCVIIYRFALALNKTDTAKRQAEKKLMHLNRQLEQKVIERTREALEHADKLKEAQAIASMGNWDIDLATGKSTWSDEMFRILGLQQEEQEPSTAVFTTFIHPDDIDNIRQKMADSSAALENSSFTCRFIRKDRMVRHCFSQWKYILNEEGKPIRLHGILQDITERKQAEEERSGMIEELVQRNTDLEQFAYIVSHNLRAPVANIVGFSKALQRPELDDTTRARFKEGLLSSAQKLDIVIKDLATILQVRRAVSEPKQPVSLVELVEDVRSSISNMIEKENVDIQYDFSIREIMALKTYMHSIFYNLISNSIKYRQPDLPPVIKISSRKKDNKIELIFSDNGMGIDLATRHDQVFGLYKRFHPHIEGKGVGLFMTKTQVETMGGKIMINSEINKGTEFKMEFIA